MKYSPIILFTYNRPDHTRQTIESLSANLLASESELIIYSDAAKNESDINPVKDTRSFIKTIKGFKAVTIIERNTNWGLANSIIDGVTNIVNQYGRIIVLEDDMLTSPFFLTYMNDALELYEKNEHIASIHGYVYPVKNKLPDYFFLKGADCWGWATWKHGWDIFNPDGQFLLDEIKRKKLSKLFNFNNSYDYTVMLQDQIDGRISSWAIRWYASSFLADKYTLYPGKSFVNNIGIDGSGTHCGYTNNYKIIFPEIYKNVPLINVQDSHTARRAFSKYFCSL